MLANVKLEQDKKRPYIHKLTVNGVDFSRYTCCVELMACEIPRVMIGMNGNAPEFAGIAEISFDENTLRPAVEVVRNELLKRGDLYEGFVASIFSVLKPKEHYVGDGESEISAEYGANFLAEEILNRIIGLEDSHGDA